VGRPMPVTPLTIPARTKVNVKTARFVDEKMVT
jgi:hypothetical protein